MTRSLHPQCAGSASYGPHSAKVPNAYTVIAPGGAVWYCCDSDCLRKTLDRQTADAAETRRSVLVGLQRIAHERGRR